MKVKATVSFSGMVSAVSGEVLDLPDGPVLADLLQAGYVEAEGGAKGEAERTDAGDGKRTRKNGP